MFSWLGDILAGLGDAISGIFQSQGAQIAEAIWNALIWWVYSSIYNGVADLFTGMNSMGAEIFGLPWVQAIVELFALFGWSLLATGIVLAVFDVAIESQNGRVSLKTTALNILKGFFAASLISVLPIKLYQFSITLQGSLAHGMTWLFAGTQGTTIGEIAIHVMRAVLFLTEPSGQILRLLFFLIVFSYCIIKVFFENIKRGGILLIQIAVGTLYLFSLPRGYAEGFYQWCKQVIALCLTAFLQTTLLFAGMLTFEDNALLGIGILLSAGEVPRIAQQFGLDSSVRVNVGSIIHSTATAVNLSRAMVRG